MQNEEIGASLPKTIKHKWINDIRVGWGIAGSHSLSTSAGRELLELEPAIQLTWGYGVIPCLSS